MHLRGWGASDEGGRDGQSRKGGSTSKVRSRWLEVQGMAAGELKSAIFYTGWKLGRRRELAALRILKLISIRRRGGKLHLLGGSPQA